VPVLIVPDVWPGVVQDALKKVGEPQPWYVHTMFPVFFVVYSPDPVLLVHLIVVPLVRVNWIGPLWDVNFPQTRPPQLISGSPAVAAAGRAAKTKAAIAPSPSSIILFFILAFQKSEGALVAQMSAAGSTLPRR
jgi:hypothetical protein